MATINPTIATHRIRSIAGPASHLHSRLDRRLHHPDIQPRLIHAQAHRQRVTTVVCRDLHRRAHTLIITPSVSMAKRPPAPLRQACRGCTGRRCSRMDTQKLAQAYLRLRLLCSMVAIQVSVDPVIASAAMEVQALQSHLCIRRQHPLPFSHHGCPASSWEGHQMALMKPTGSRECHSTAVGLAAAAGAGIE